MDPLLEQIPLHNLDQLNWKRAKTEMELAAIAESHGHNRIIASVVVEHLQAAIKALSPDSSNTGK